MIEQKRKEIALKSALSNGMDNWGKRIPRPGNGCVKDGRVRLVGFIMAAEAFMVELCCLAGPVQGSMFEVC